MDRDTRIFVGIMAGIVGSGIVGHAIIGLRPGSSSPAAGTSTSSSLSPAPGAGPETTTAAPQAAASSAGTGASPTTEPPPPLPPEATVLAQSSPEAPSAVDDAPPVGCGVERQALKVGRDAGAGAVPLTPRTTTIAALSAYANDTGPDRIAPVETTVWRITAHLTDYKAEDDSDYHLVIRDSQGRSMIAELADPGCAQGSPWLRQITAARNSFDAHLRATSSFRTTDITVTVTGVGFFDYPHGQRGVAPNAVELHPVLSITFG